MVYLYNQTDSHSSLKIFNIVLDLRWNAETFAIFLSKWPQFKVSRNIYHAKYNLPLYTCVETDKFWCSRLVVYFLSFVVTGSLLLYFLADQFDIGRIADIIRQPSCCSASADAPWRCPKPHNADHQCDHGSQPWRKPGWSYRIISERNTTM